MSGFAKRGSKRIGSAVLMLIALAVAGAAQVGMPYPPPRRSLQRPAFLQYVSGEVSVAPSATNDWKAAQLNQPLKASEYVWTATSSKAEINLGGGFLRMNSEASLTLVALSPNNVRVSVNQGEVSLTVFRLLPGEIYELDTPNATLTVSKTGVYRVEVRPSEEKTLVTTRKGSIVATGNGPAVKVDSGQQVTFLGGNSLQHTAEKAPPQDGFEEWAAVRNKRLGATHPPFVWGFGYGPYPYGAVVAPGPPPPPPPY